MLLASGQCRTLECEAAGSPVGLGVDGSASNDGSNMAQELRQAFLLQRLRYGAEHITHDTVINWATRGSAACLGRSDIGTLAVGSCADLAFFSLNDIRYSGADDPLAALVLCGTDSAEHVMVNGQWKVRNGEPVDIDLEALKAQHRGLARRLLERVA